MADWMGEPVRSSGAKEQIAATIVLVLLIRVCVRLWVRFQEWLIPVEDEPEEDEWNGDFYGG